VARLWDDSLYRGSAEYYLTGRLPYPERLRAALREHLPSDCRGRLLDLGCGPGSLTLLLAPLFDEVVAVDADAEMVAVGQREATRHGLTNVAWQRAAAEDLGDVGPFDVVTLAQSFHWMDRPVVAAKIRHWLKPGGYCVHVGATTHESAAEAHGLPHPLPPRQVIQELIRSYLGPQRRAGQGINSGCTVPGDEDGIYGGAGLVGPEVVTVPGGDVFERTEDEVVASVLSLSSAAPHLFGDRLPEFVHDLRGVLRSASPDGVFSEQLPEIRLSLWRR